MTYSVSNWKLNPTLSVCLFVDLRRSCDVYVFVALFYLYFLLIFELFVLGCWYDYLCCSLLLLLSVDLSKYYPESKYNPERVKLLL